MYSSLLIGIVRSARASADCALLLLLPPGLYIICSSIAPLYFRDPAAKNIETCRTTNKLLPRVFGVVVVVVVVAVAAAAATEVRLSTIGKNGALYTDRYACVPFPL